VDAVGDCAGSQEGSEAPDDKRDAHTPCSENLPYAIRVSDVMGRFVDGVILKLLS
jgi:hypothetical protein